VAGQRLRLCPSASAAPPERGEQQEREQRTCERG